MGSGLHHNKEEILDQEIRISIHACFQIRRLNAQVMSEFRKQGQNGNICNFLQQGLFSLAIVFS